MRRFPLRKEKAFGHVFFFLKEIDNLIDAFLKILLSPSFC